ncbi:uncharacterized protein LOC131289655 [Anopheles ziemanni]|uniref:uncharacterized protein LOC131260543 n=1 Tax=Anopheles coustani TaxID=139045 RepID=UPI00265A8859|nr:uncharacterized protein LOC131260543 [Anopheles coustani]XP_058174936.1 uncharacterized protein LOC131289655 [Anopheles ziemanni]
MARTGASGTPPYVQSVRFVSISMVLAVASALLLPEFEYESVPFPADDIERDLLFDGRSWSFHGHDVIGPAEEGAFYQSDVNLAALRPISPTPPFTLDPSYISPAEVIPARAKRANRMGKKRATKQRKREQLKDHSYEEMDRDEMLEDDNGEEDEEGKAHSGEVEESEVGGDVEDYAARYEKFIAQHFDDVERRREKSAPQRKAPTRGRAESKEDGRADETDGNEEDESDGDYKFDRFDYSSSDDYERIKAESEEQSRRLAKDPRNCRTYEKDGMVCSVCHDPASDSASESCAYATEPHHRKYAYVKERNYDSKKPDGTGAAGGKADQELTEDGDDGEHEQLAESRPERQTSDEDTTLTTTTAAVPRRRKAHPIRKPMLRSKPHQLATNGGGYRYQPPAIDLRSNRASMKLRSAVTGSDGESQTEDDPNIYVMDYNDQDDVARVLAEFKSRDWSKCRKGKRTGGDGGGLTCYQCQDAAGVNHEECMYVSESRQVATGIALPPTADEGKLRKRKKVVPLRRKNGSMVDSSALEPTLDGSPTKEKQTVKRTVSFRSFVTGSGTGQERPAAFPLPADASERVIHYEHHISHEVP